MHVPCQVLFVTVIAASAFSIQCSIGEYYVNDAICSSVEICGNDIDDDCNGIKDDGCECAKIGQTRLVYPNVNRADELAYGGSSKCSLGIETCVKSATSSGLTWSVTKVAAGPAVPSGKPENICDSKDDDCNGIVDDLPGIGMSCTSSTVPNNFGYCLAGGVQRCSAKSGTLDCFAQPKSVLNINRYYSNPYVDSSNNPGWDWSCDGLVNLITCQLSALNNFPYFDRPSTLPQSCALNIALPGTIPSIQPYTPSICSACTTSNTSYWQYTSALPFPSTIQSSECGRIFTIAQCSGTSSSTCRVTNVDALTILCQ